MLDKTNYTTRTDLTSEEISALVTVREKLASSEINGFDMRSCSSCIGHFVGRELGMSFDVAGSWTVEFAHRGKFQQLFFPSFSGLRYSDMAESDAAVAITNFLNGDEFPWGRSKYWAYTV